MPNDDDLGPRRQSDNERHAPSTSSAHAEEKKPPSSSRSSEERPPDSALTSAGAEPLFRLLEAAAREPAGPVPPIHVETDEGDEQEAPSLRERRFELDQMAHNQIAGGKGGLDGPDADERRTHIRVPSEFLPSEESEEEASVYDLAEEDKIALIKDDFGQLDSEGQPEKLVAETDSGIISGGALILGVLRLTSYRVAFHASLPPAVTRKSAIDTVLHAGALKVGRRRNLLRPRTAWCELTPDMLTTYPNSTEEGRVRPLRSDKLSSIEAVNSPKSREPNVFSIVFRTHGGHFTAYFEVGTEEGALAWVREIRSALLLFRHRQKLHVEPGQSPDLKLSIPLSRIRSIDSQSREPLAYILTLDLIQDHTNTTIPEPIIHRVQQTTKRKHDLEEANIIIQFGLVGEEDSFPEELKQAWRTRCQQTYGLEQIVLRGSGFDEEEVEETMKTNAKGDPNTIHALRRRFGVIEGDVFYQHCIRRSKMWPSYGLIVITDHFLCFWSRSVFSKDIQLRFPLHNVENAHVEKSQGPGWYGLVITVTGHDELHFEFRKMAWRDNFLWRLQEATETARRQTRVEQIQQEETDAVEPSPLARIQPGADKYEHAFAPSAISRLPKPINMPETLRYTIRPRHFVCLSIGSRGDVQPYIALAKGLIKEGHSVTIVTHEEYKEWIENWGVQHRTAGGDAAALMKLSVEHRMFSPQFFKETLTKFREWLDELLIQSWEGCKDADVLIESPSAMGGIHIAEALEIPYFRAFTMPWTRTKQYPHAFLNPPLEISGPMNYYTYVLFDNIFWKATSRQINRWRKTYLDLNATDVRGLAQTKVPFLYNFSPSVVPKPLDWDESVIITGYWFLDDADPDWEPTEDLSSFLKSAKEDGKPLVYIGFGSIVVPDPAAMTSSIVKAVQKADVRAILSEGWAARLIESKSTEAAVPLPPEIYKVDKIPHDWLFPRIDVAVHHGGAGTTGASLRSGIPTLIKPWFGDQFFWASRVQKLGAGLRINSLKSDALAEALVKATTDRVMKEKASQVGEKIRAEHGVDRAIDAIYTYLPRAAHDRTKLSKHTKVLNPENDHEHPAQTVVNEAAG
ncbi:glycosyltransferase family 1 protein [Calocera cornea HHB12733]|uniref:sterol 3beta-glucosyltransferase n=1 Tax=Calocera cornea HHB12733 TaxID=1353952 RepID=A0A165CRS1_9BASI|nr:glycosyltransferase family 1 protein [Calocera cornea HHB12733]